MLDLMRDPEATDSTPAMESAGDGAEATEAMPPNQPGTTSLPPSGEVPPGAAAVDWGAFADEVRSDYDAANEPLNLARWSSALVDKLGHGLSAGGWFGAGGFGRALARVGLEVLATSQHFAWDTRRHQAPAETDSGSAGGLPPEIARFCQIVQLPRIPSDRWPVVFQSLEAYALMHDFQLTESTRWSRDHAAQQGIDVPSSTRACAPSAGSLTDRNQFGFSELSGPSGWAQLFR